MTRGRFLGVLATLWAAMIVAFAAPAYAAPVPVAATCRAAGDLAEGWRAVAADRSRWRWRCDGQSHGLGPEVSTLRFDLTPGAPAPRSLVAHYGQFSKITLIALDRDGTARSRTVTMDTVRRVAAGPFISAPLPSIAPDTVAVFARVELPWVEHTLTGAWLDNDPAGSGWPIDVIIALAVLCGVLLVPLMLNAAFYWAMPERYVVWHLLMVSSALVQVAVLIGLIPELVPLPYAAQLTVVDISFPLLSAGALMFLSTFIEQGTLGPRYKWALQAQAIFVVTLISTITLFVPALRAYATIIYHLSLAISILLLSGAMVVAWRNGSRLVLFQIVGWTPSLLVCSWRMASFFTSSIPSEAPVAYHAGLAFEVLATAVAIVSRFGHLRRERDLALDRTEQLEDEVGHDPLTGLNNRRGIEARFEELRRAGFDTLAVIDLDHFKQINDACGHAVGDRVLAATGQALRDDPDLCAWRLGGEEFLLLLRGRNAMARAESRRKAITARVAALVPGLPGPVTASMGVVELQRSSMLATGYAELYARADRLLYEAKRTGRNRTCSEKLTVFGEGERRKRDRRDATSQVA